MFQLSPGVNVSEIDLAGGVAAVSTTEAAMAGVFRWGPVGKRFLVTSETNLALQAGKPTNFNAETWFSAANFLAYSDALYVTRVTTGTSAMAVFAGSTAPIANTQTVLNDDLYSSVSFSANVGYVAKYVGDLGNSLRVSVCDSVNAYYKSINLVSNNDIAVTSNVAISVGASTGTVYVGFAGSGTQLTANTQATNVKNSLQVGDNIRVGNSSVGTQFLRIANIGNITSNSTIASFNVTFDQPYRLYADWTSTSVDRYWEFHNIVNSAPGVSAYNGAAGNTAAVDELHVVVVDDGGKFTGVPGTVLEVHSGLSRATDAKTVDGSANYYKDVLNTNSNYVWFASERAGAASNVAVSVTSASTDTPLSVRFTGGTDGDDENTIALGKLAQGYDTFKDGSSDTTLIITGKARANDGVTFANYLVDNIGETRKNCVVFVSPPKEAVVNNAGRETESVVAFANQLRSTSYGFLDCNYKYQYDKYNDVYRWVPTNADIAGLVARTGQTNDVWWSPAGSNRGRIKNVVKLAWNPSKAQRDALYKASANPVISESGTGPILFGDKTLLKKSSPFDRINVRMLFIVLKKSIAKDSEAQLFEFNDEFTQSQFRSRTVPYLRDIQGRRGVTDYLVVCDATNNTPEVVDREEFQGDIYVKPNKAINSIQLNFVAVRSGVEFNEIVGQF